jgi:hypothetical protein
MKTGKVNRDKSDGVNELDKSTNAKMQHKKHFSAAEGFVEESDRGVLNHIVLRGCKSRRVG